MATNGELAIYLLEEADEDMLKKALEAEGLKWAYVERVKESVFLSIEELSPLARWQHGRAFGSQLQVNWWRKRESYRLVLLTEQASLSGNVPWQKAKIASPWTALPDFDLAAGQVRLTGERSEGEAAWFEARLPRPLHYPDVGTPPPRKVALRIRRYRGKEGGIWTRMLCLEASEKERDA